MKKIIQNEIQCKKCSDIIWSATTHDYVTCRCGAVSVDGGMSYLKRSGEKGDRIERSMVMDSLHMLELVGVVDDAKATGRNSLGISLAVIRYLRDHDYLKMEKFK